MLLVPNNFTDTVHLFYTLLKNELEEELLLCADAAHTLHKDDSCYFIQGSREVDIYTLKEFIHTAGPSTKKQTSDLKLCRTCSDGVGQKFWIVKALIQQESLMRKIEEDTTSKEDLDAILNALNGSDYFDLLKVLPLSYAEKREMHDTLWQGYLSMWTEWFKKEFKTLTTGQVYGYVWQEENGRDFFGKKNRARLNAVELVAAKQGRHYLLRGSLEKLLDQRLQLDELIIVPSTPQTKEIEETLLTLLRDGLSITEAWKTASALTS